MKKKTAKKRLLVRVSLVCIVTAIILLALSGLLSHVEGGPSFRFLKDHKPVAYRSELTARRWRSKNYYYSFPADFNDICLNARAELISAGFLDRTHPPKKSLSRLYVLRGRFLRGQVAVLICKDHDYVGYEDPKYARLHPKDGWVTVEVVCVRRLWIPW